MVVNKPKIIVIVGPTGSGKTALAVALARRIRHAGARSAKQTEAIASRPGFYRPDRSGLQNDILFELVSADSRQVYRGMDIGTGKEIAPDIPHHLIDIVNPDEDFTLADFLAHAKKVIADIHARGRVPIVVGGTGLYVQALVENWDIPAVKPDQAFRAELEKKSVAELQKELAVIDTEEAERLGAGKRYLIRALEMWHATGRKPSALKTKNEPLYDALVIGINLQREELYARIDARVDDMFARGLAEEVRGLLKKYPADLPAFRTIGYREIIEYCHAGARSAKQAEAIASREVSGRDPIAPTPSALQDDKLIQSIKYHTHAYARRQLTWLRRMKYIVWCRATDEALTKVRKFFKI